LIADSVCDQQHKDDYMIRLFPALTAIAVLAAISACAPVDRAAGTNTSGRYPSQSNGTPGNPPGTEATRTLDRAAGTDVSGAYPSQRDGTPSNPPGTAATRTYDRATGSNTSGAYPQNRSY
jgi:hypothetical protein